MIYNPTYTEEPFTDFASITRETALESLNLNWRERDLPERLRTKHVHRLHPYLGKFIPQLVEIFLRKYHPKTVCDPFSGSGTTLVEANTLGIESIGCDVSPFNCLLTKVKLAEYDIPSLEKEVKDIVQKVNMRLRPGLFFGDWEDTDNEYLRQWYAQSARQQLLFYRSLIPNYRYQDFFKVILSRAARSARLTTHFDLDFPKRPQTEPYSCYKHSRICQPTDNALQFLTRYTWDSFRRVKEFSSIRTRAPFTVICADARDMSFPEVDMVFTSPPYVGLIDYHEQHRYAYELLGLPINERLEIGAATNGSSMAAKQRYVADISKTFENVTASLNESGVMAVVVNDKHKLYEGMAQKLGLDVAATLSRHVNRRTGRRAGDFFESVLIWRKC